MTSQNEVDQTMLKGRKATQADHTQQLRQEIDLQGYKGSRLSSYLFMSEQRDQDGWI